MKTRKTILFVILTLGVLLFLTNCASIKTPLPTDNIDELLGTWVNPEYDNLGPARAKNVFKEDRTIARYRSTKDGNPYNVHYIIDVEEKWMDRKGVVYFKAFIDKRMMSTTNVLIKIDSDRKTLEILEAARMESLPSEMDPDASYCVYYILYRQ